MEYVSAKPEPGEVVMDYSLVGGDHTARGRKLFFTGSVLLAAAMCYLTYKAEVNAPEHLLLGLLILVLSVIPFLIWARSGGSRFPVFETIMGLCANGYAMPVLNAHEQLAGYAPSVITKASVAVVLYQLSGIAVYYTIKGIPGRSRFWRESIISHQIERLTVYGLLLSVSFVYVYEFTSIIPDGLVSPLRAVFYGISILCTFISAQRWGRGEMTPGEKSTLICCVALQVLMMCTGLLLIGAVSLIGIALLGYLSGGKRIPWLVIALTFSLLAILHNGKSKMRTKYWNNDLPRPTVTQLPAYFSEWLNYGLEPSSDEKSVGHKILERTSLMHILCLIVEYTPSRQSYLYGDTYTHVLPQMIPRFFWPEKPRSHVATYQLAIYYGLQDENATFTTTIAFGLLTEAYANFGMIGAMLLGVFWGFWLKKLQIWSTFSPMFSFAGLLMVLLTAWSFSAELTMAAWVSSLQQAVLVVLGIPLLLRALLGL